MTRIILFLFSCLFMQQNSCLGQGTITQIAFEESYKFESAGKFKDAINAFNKAYTSNSYEMNLRLGWLYYSMGDYTASEKYYKMAVDLAPKSIEAKLGYVLPLSGQDEWDMIINVYKDILNIQPLNYIANYRIGLIYYNRKDYATAKPFLDNALVSYPFDYDIVVLTAWNYLQLNAKDMATSLFKRALILSPGDPSALEGLGQSNTISPLQTAFEESYKFEGEGKLKSAIDALNKAYSPTSYEAVLRMGWLYYSFGDNPNAEKYYKTAVDLMPKSIEAKLGYVLPLATVNKWDDVIKQYKDILVLDPMHSLVNYRMGLIYYNRKNYNTAKTYLDNAIMVYPFDYDIVILAAWNNLMLGKKEPARSLFNKALLMSPNDVSAISGLSKI